MSIPPSPEQAQAACPARVRPRFSAAGVSGSGRFRGLRLRQDSDRTGGRA
jgi:hypothetical protein